MKKDYTKVEKQIQKVIDEALKILPIIEKSKYSKEILNKLEDNPLMRDFVIKLQCEIEKIEVLKQKLK